jgi:hypothetical protein
VSFCFDVYMSCIVHKIVLLCLVINAENAAHRSEKFATMATRTRQEYLKDLANNYTTTTVVDPGQKFCKASYLFVVHIIPCVNNVSARYIWQSSTSLTVCGMI